MKRQPLATESGHCGHGRAFRSATEAAGSRIDISAIPCRVAAQVTDGVWNAVVTTLGRGTFLIRRRERSQAAACPLQAYEIRHIAADLPQVRSL